MASHDHEIRILLAAGQALFREAVRVALDGQAGFRVVAEAGDGPQAVGLAAHTRPDVALIEADLPGGDGATSTILDQAPGCRVLILSTEEDVTTLIAALRAGASGYMAKARPLTELIDAARAIGRGETVVPPWMIGELVTRLLESRRAQDEALRRISRLTSREREVLALLADGGNNDAIAQALVISRETARTHIQNILGKLSVHSRLAAVAFVIQNDLREELEPSNGEVGAKRRSTTMERDLVEVAPEDAQRDRKR